LPELYQYEEKSRRPATILALMLFIAMTMIALYAKADWYFFIPIVIGGAMLVWMVIVNRTSGARLNEQRLYLYIGTWQKTINVSDMASLKVTRWSDGAPTLTLKLKTGKSELVSSNCVGDSKTFCAALEQLGIPVHIK
jgi:hypothetical protein